MYCNQRPTLLEGARRLCKNIYNKAEKDSSSMFPNSTSRPTVEFNYQRASPPAKIRVIETNSNPYQSSQTEQAMELALRMRQEEKDRLEKAKEEIANNNRRVFADGSTAESGFITARDKLHLNELEKNPNQQPQKRLGYARNIPSNTFKPFKSPLIQNTDEKPCPTEDDDKNHPLLATVDPEMIEKIKREIAECTDSISFDDVAGLQEAKKMIYEAVVLPLQRPDLFTGLRSAPKGILLFGPPGTGKTMIGKCIARQANATFFSISSAALTSKWIGEGEKLVKALFLYARVRQPSVIFIDEIDSMLTKRSENECDANRRLKTEFLVQLEGATSNREDKVLLIGATNLPQELDEAAKRRFTRRLYIPLPDRAARRQLVEILLRQNEHNVDKCGLDWIADATDGYSGSDIKNLCAEAAMGPTRDFSPMELMTRNVNSFRPIGLVDFESGMKNVKATVSKESLDSYLKWNEAYGST